MLGEERASKLKAFDVIFATYIYWIIPVSVILFIFVYLSPPFSDEQRIIFAAIFTLIPFVISYFWSSGKVPYTKVDYVRRNATFFSLVIVTVAVIVASLIWIPFLVEISISQQISYFDSLIPTISISIVGSLIVLAKSIRQRDYQQTPLALYQIDLHKKVCWSIGVEPVDALKGYRHRKHDYKYQQSFRVADLRTTEASAEVTLSLVSVSVFAGLLFVVMLLLDPLDTLSVQQILAISFMGLMMTPILYYGVRMRFLSWREYWTTYWSLMRTLSLPEELLPEVLPQIPRAIMVPVESEDMGSIERETRLLAKKWGLDSPTPTDDIDEWIEWAYWWHRTKEMMKHVGQKVRRIPDLKEMVSLLEENPKRFVHEIYLRNLRYSLIIESAERLSDWVEIYDGVIKTIVWFQEKQPSEIHKELFDRSIEQIEEIHSLPSWPIPQTIKWLVGLSMLMLSIFPIVLSMIGTILQP